MKLLSVWRILNYSTAQYSIFQISGQGYKFGWFDLIYDQNAELLEDSKGYSF